jgi:hypothetical protein
MRKPLSRPFGEGRPRLDVAFIANMNLFFRLARKLINFYVVKKPHFQPLGPGLEVRLKIFIRLIPPIVHKRC